MFDRATAPRHARAMCAAQTIGRKTRPKRNIISRRLRGIRTIWIAAVAAIISLAPLAFASGDPTAASPKTVKVGVLTKGNTEQALRMWSPTIQDYLTKTVPNYRFVVVPLGFRSIEVAIARNEIDFVLTNSASYVDLEARYGIGRIATLKNHWADNISTTLFGAVIFSGRDHSAIGSWQDLTGKSFAAVNDASFGGWLMALREFAATNIRPARDFTRIEYLGSHESVVNAVLEGRIEVGTVRTGVLEQMALNGSIDLSKIRVVKAPLLAKERIQEYGFPFLFSTRLYPEWPFSKLHHTDTRLAEKVAVALLTMPPDSPEAVAAGIAGWTVPLNYEPVHALMRELEMSPYTASGRLDFARVVRAYWHWFAIIGAAICILLVVTVVVLRLNRRIVIAKSELEREAGERSRAEETLRNSEQRFRSLVETTNDFVWETDAQGRFTYVSPQVRSLLGYVPSELLGKHANTILAKGAQPYLPDNAPEKAGQYTPFVSIATTMRHSNGCVAPFECSGVPILDDEGRLQGFRGINRDITSRRQTEEALYRVQELAHVTLDSISDGVIRTDMNGNVEYINPAASRLIGVSENEAQGKPLTDLFRVIDELSGESLRLLPPSIPPGHINRLVSGNTALVRGHADRIYIDIRLAPVRDSNNRTMGTVIVFHDITEVRRLTREIAYHATHDVLTELLNRSEFELRLGRALETAKVQATHHVMCYLDLDQFKIINDTSGHIAGDALLKQLAARLTHLVREYDVLARLGGDEFGILLMNCSVGDATTLVNNMLRAVADHTFIWHNKTFQITLSAGLVQVNAAAGTLTDILSAADSACYVAKEHGRNRIHWFQPNDAAVTKHHGQMQWVRTLRRALNENRFRLYTEAFVPLSERASPHYEVLLRLISEEDGREISPMSFIPAAERYHLMPAIDRWVIAATLQCLDKRAARGPFTGVYAINLSGQSLSDDEFLSYTVDQIDKSRISPRQLCFEITETAAIANLPRALRFMAVLRGMGCRFALDDFGSGFSSYAYLKNLPVDYLKIDGSFVRNLEQNPIERAMVAAINDIGHLMGLQTIAECVDTQATLDAVAAMGIDYAQGHSIAAVEPLSDLCAAPDLVPERKLA